MTIHIHKSNINFDEFKFFTKDVKLNRFYIFCGVQHHIALKWVDDRLKELGLEEMPTNSAIQLSNTLNSWLYYCNDRKYHIIKKKGKLCQKDTDTKKDLPVRKEAQ